jgi:hypothetical protein
MSRYNIPHSPGLKIDWCPGKNCSSYRLARLTAVHDSPGNGREVTAQLVNYLLQAPSMIATHEVR